MPNELLLEYLYRHLDVVNKSMVNNITEGSLVDHTLEQAKAMLDRATKTNRAWHTRESEVISLAPFKILSRERLLKEEAREESTTKMMTKIELLTKHVMRVGAQKVNALRENDIDYIYDKEANFVNNKLGSSRPNYQPNKVFGGKEVGNKVGTRRRDI